MRAVNKTEKQWLLGEIRYSTPSTTKILAKQRHPATSPSFSP